MIDTLLIARKELAEFEKDQIVAYNGCGLKECFSFFTVSFFDQLYI